MVLVRLLWNFLQSHCHFLCPTVPLCLCGESSLNARFRQNSAVTANRREPAQSLINARIGEFASPAVFSKLAGNGYNEAKFEGKYRGLGDDRI